MQTRLCSEKRRTDLVSFQSIPIFLNLTEMGQNP
jgi:hypothetical protein